MIKFNYYLCFILLLKIYLIGAANITSVTFSGSLAIIIGDDIDSTTEINLKFVQNGLKIVVEIDNFTTPSAGKLQLTIPDSVAYRGLIVLQPSGAQADWNPVPTISSLSGAPISGGIITVNGNYLCSFYESAGNKSTLTFPHGETLQEFLSSALNNVAFFTFPASISMLYSGVNIPITLTVRGINQTVSFTYDKPNITGVSYINTGLVLNGVNFGSNISLVKLATDSTTIVISNLTNTGITILYNDNPILSSAGTRYLNVTVNGNSLSSIYTLTIAIQILGYYQIHDKGYLLTNVPVTNAGKATVQLTETDFNPYTSPNEQGISFSLPWDASIGNTTVDLNFGLTVMGDIPISIQPSLDNITYGNPCPVSGCNLVFHGFFLQQSKTSIRNLTFGDIPCYNSYTSSYNQLQCTVANGTGANLPVLLVYNNGVTNPSSDKLFLSFEPPTVQNVGITDNNLTINGTGFNYPLTVMATINSTNFICKDPYVRYFTQISCAFDKSIGEPDKIYLNITVGNQFVADDYPLYSFATRLSTNLSVTILIILLIFQSI